MGIGNFIKSLEKKQKAELLFELEKICDKLRNDVKQEQSTVPPVDPPPPPPPPESVG